MTDLSVPTADIHASALRAQGSADDISQITWAAMDSDALAGSAVGAAAADPWLPTTLHALVTDMRSWVAASRASAAAAADADTRLADDLPVR